MEQKAEYLHKKEIAAMLGVTPRWVDFWRKKGKIPVPITIGITPLWSRAEFLEFLASRRGAK